MHDDVAHAARGEVIGDARADDSGSDDDDGRHCGGDYRRAAFDKTLRCPANCRFPGDREVRLLHILDSSRYGFSPFAVPTLVTAALMLVFGASVLARRLSRMAGAFFAHDRGGARSGWSPSPSCTARRTPRRRSSGRASPTSASRSSRRRSTTSPRRCCASRKERRGAIVAGVGRWPRSSPFLGVTGVLVVRVQHFWWGFYPRYSLLIAPPFLLFFFGYLIASLVEFVRAYPKSRGVEKKRIRLLLIAFAVAYLGCVDYLPKFGIAVYPFGYVAAVRLRRDRRASPSASTTSSPITPSLAAREIIGTMADVLFVCDRDGRIEFANAAAERVLGYRAESLVGRQFDELLVRATTIRSATRSAAAASATWSASSPRRDGQQVDLMMSLAPVLHARRAGRRGDHRPRHARAEATPSAKCARR